MVTLIGMSGSLRRGSFNSAVLRVAAALMPADSELCIVNKEKRPGSIFRSQNACVPGFL